MTQSKLESATKILESCKKRFLPPTDTGWTPQAIKSTTTYYLPSHTSNLHNHVRCMLTQDVALSLSLFEFLSCLAIPSHALSPHFPSRHHTLPSNHHPLPNSSSNLHNHPRCRLTQDALSPAFLQVNSCLAIPNQPHCVSRRHAVIKPPAAPPPPPRLLFWALGRTKFNRSATALTSTTAIHYRQATLRDSGPDTLRARPSKLIPALLILRPAAAKRPKSVLLPTRPDPTHSQINQYVCT